MLPRGYDPTLFTTESTAEPPGPASGAFLSVARAGGRRRSASCLRQTALRLWPALPHRTGEYASGALGREPPRPQDLATPHAPRLPSERFLLRKPHSDYSLRYDTVVNKVG